MRNTKQVHCGNVPIGAGAPISIQSMTNVDSCNEKALLEQIARLTDAGCQIVRIAVPNQEAVQVFGSVKKKLGNKVPLVADIHFDYRLAIGAIEAGADKVRINPGNIGDLARVKAVVEAAKERQIPLRIGVNSGSLEKPILEKYGGVTAKGLAESAYQNICLVENLGYEQLVVSLKSSDVQMNYQAHKLLAQKTEYPIHIGVTETGTAERGKVKSAVGIGALLLEGIGDTMRVSLTADPVEEVLFAKEILRSLGMGNTVFQFVSCPTCGRTKIDLASLATKIEKALVPLEEKLSKQGHKPVKVAVMGCAVNGPGEAREADFGVAGGDGRALLFASGQIIKSVEEKNVVEEFLTMIEKGIV